MEQHGLVAIPDEVRRHDYGKIARRRAGDDEVSEIVCLEELAPLCIAKRFVVSVDQHLVNCAVGVPDLNSGLQRPKRCTLPTELHPGRAFKESFVSPYRMTVRAHEFAFGELFEDEFSAPCPDLGADLAELDRARQVIPLHDLGRE